MAMLEWTVEEEVHLFTALSGLRPVGLNKHFYMATVVERLSKSLKRDDINADIVWKHLRTMYNLSPLEEVEPLPFNNDERDFFLPENEFGAHLLKKRSENDGKSQEDVNNSNPATGPPSIIAVVTDNMKANNSQGKDIDKKAGTKFVDVQKRAQKRTRGSTSLETASPSSTPPPLNSNKRRRI